ncbi:acyl-CoA dehydrogenase family protein, partial [Xanthomonas sacchari]|uniref:acyl-CoA dehydrogenase family protein n=1 Tax=Xanthomonas sacchari TaxID=56458 RepID=UPI00292C5C99
MDFDLNEDQSLLRDSVERLAADLYPSLESRQARLKAPLGFSAEGWAAFSELGVTGLPFSEEDGGLGGGPVETLLVMEAVGRNLVVEPLLASLVLGSTALRLGGSAAQKERLVPGLVAGDLRLTLAHTERQSRYDLADVATTARR